MFAYIPLPSPARMSFWYSWRIEVQSMSSGVVDVKHWLWAISLKPLQMEGRMAAEHWTSFRCYRKGGKIGRHHGLHNLQHPKQNENAGSLAQKMIKNFEMATTDHLTSSLPFQVTTEVTHPWSWPCKKMPGLELFGNSLKHFHYFIGLRTPAFIVLHSHNTPNS